MDFSEKYKVYFCEFPNFLSHCSRAKVLLSQGPIQGGGVGGTAPQIDDSYQSASVSGAHPGGGGQGGRPLKLLTRIFSTACF